MATEDTQRPPTDRLPESVVDDILASDRRCIALEVLSERDEPVVIDDLAAAVLARERETTPDEIPRSDRTAIRGEFFEKHLPKLTATDVVGYDSMLGTIELTADEEITERLS